MAEMKIMTLVGFEGLIRPEVDKNSYFQFSNTI